MVDYRKRYASPNSKGYHQGKDERKFKSEYVGKAESITKNVRGWAGNWDAVYDNILLRAKIKEEIVNVSDKTGNPNLLEAPFNVLSNDAFHRISDKVREEIGLPLGKNVFPEWQSWLNKQIKGRSI